MNRFKNCIRTSLPCLCFWLSLSSCAYATDALLDIRPHEAPDRCDADTAQIRVKVNNVDGGGMLTVELYNDPDNFLNKSGRLRRIRIPASAAAEPVCFSISEAGSYAVASYHDIDGNRKLKRQWNRMPAEPFGLSNNPELTFGFPKFSNSAFTSDERGADITIDLRQP